MKLKIDKSMFEDLLKNIELNYGERNKHFNKFFDEDDYMNSYNADSGYRTNNFDEFDKRTYDERTYDDKMKEYVSGVDSILSRLEK